MVSLKLSILRIKRIMSGRHGDNSRREFVTKISYNALTSSGEAHGRMDPALDRGITPQKAALTIIRGIRRNRREILVGSTEQCMLYIRRFSINFL
ncbi:MAG: hypothetical protein R2727_00785 [Bacteroidales bacterium]